MKKTCKTSLLDDCVRLRSVALVKNPLIEAIIHAAEEENYQQASAISQTLSKDIHADPAIRVLAGSIHWRIRARRY